MNHTIRIKDAGAARELEELARLIDSLTPLLAPAKALEAIQGFLDLVNLGDDGVLLARQDNLSSASAGESVVPLEPGHRLRRFVLATRAFERDLNVLLERHKGCLLEAASPVATSTGNFSLPNPTDHQE